MLNYAKGELAKVQEKDSMHLGRATGKDCRAEANSHDESSVIY